MAHELDDDIVDIQPPQNDEDIVSVEQAPSILSQLGSQAQETVAPALETGLDFASGTAKGLSMGSLDELGGLIGAGVETGLGKLGIGPAAVDQQLAEQGFQVPQESFLQKYRGYQQASEQAQKEAAERSPVAETLGQLGGGLTGGALLGGLAGIGKGAQGAKSLSEIAKNEGKAKAALELLKRGGKTYVQAAPAIAAESALTSEQQLLGENAKPTELAKDVAGGLAFGLPAILGLEGISQVAAPSVKKAIQQTDDKISELIKSENNPRLRQMYKAYKDYGQEIGVHPRSHGADIAENGFAQRDQKAVGTVLDTLNDADAKLGQEVGASLQKATDRGAVIDITPEIQAAGDRIAQLSQQIPQLGQSRRSAAAMEKVLTGQTQLTPSELKTLIDDIDSSIGVLKSATNITPQDSATLSELLKFRSGISDTLKKQVPEYRLAASRFEGFRNVLEQLISRDKPADVTEKFYGKLNNQQDKLYSSLRDMVENVQESSASAQPARTSFANFMDSLKKFEGDEVARLGDKADQSRVIPHADSLRKFILDASDDSVLRGSARNVTQGRSITPDLKEAFIGKLPTTGAFYAGKAVKKAQEVAQKPLIKGTADVSRAIYKAPAQALSNVASRLESSGQFESLGRALRESLESGDSAKKNAALFTIMQNPNSRAFIQAEDLDNEEAME